MPLMLLDTTLCGKVCQSLVTLTGWWCSGNPVSSTNKTDCCDLTEILLKVVLNTITLNNNVSGYSSPPLL